MSAHSGIDQEQLDQEIRPQDDLFGHVNGTWLATAEIPQDRGRYGAFDLLRENAEADVRALIEESAAQRASDTNSGDSNTDSDGGVQAKVGDLYASFMDTDRIERLGLEPLAPELAQIAQIDDTSALVRLAGALQRGGVDGPLHLWMSADAGDPDVVIAYLHQGGLGLPEEAYYREPEHEEARAAYRRYLNRLLESAAEALSSAGLAVGTEPGAPDTEQIVDRVIDLETAIAAAHWDRVTVRDAVKAYTRLSFAELTTSTPGFDWDAYREGLGATPEQFAQLVARQPDVLSALGVLLAERDLEDWRWWLVVRLLDSTAPYLPEEFVSAHFDFHAKALSGTPQIRDRWRRGVALVEELLGEAAGELYVARHYPPEAAQRMEELLANVLAAFRVRITELEWMGAETRERALDKLARFRPKIGHPPRWRDYSAYVVDAADLVGNVRRGHAVDSDRQLAQIGGPVDRDEWLMTPQTVNAYYHPMLNEIVFPAAILQPPFFDVNADDAVNYGGIGAVIAHEIGHGFDDQGSRYAGDGSLQEWWTQADREAFDARAQRLIEQFGALESRGAPGSAVNGGLTVGENIGDLCGLELSLAAYRLAGLGPDIDGWTAEERFFLGWAQVWRSKARPEEAKRLLAIDPHSPADLRGNAVRNVDAFHEVFGTSPGDGLWLDPEDRVRVF